MKIITTNRKARRDYQIKDSFEAGIALKGTEVKALRTKGCSLDESFARLERGELFLHNMHIPEFEKSSYFTAEPKRVRKLLVHKREIKRLFGLCAQRGLTLIPLKIYFNQRGLVKVEIALAKGRNVYDKRKKIKDKIIEKEVSQTLKKYRAKY